MFYDIQLEDNKIAYKEMLSIVGSLSRIFSDAKEPYLYYRAHENIFSKYFDADNLSREDCSADAKKDGIGIGLKTWVGRDDQKVAEFGKLKKEYENLTGLELVKKIAYYRNKRISITKNMHGLTDMIYHIVKRIPGHMQILECTFDMIDIDNITLLEDRGNYNNTYFTDGKHTYHFSTSKNTLYMIFEDMDLLDEFKVNIVEDPYELLSYLNTSKGGLQGRTLEYAKGITSLKNITKPQLCLRLYSTKKDGTKFVGEKSGLNQWNAGGRARNIDELYIPFPVTDRVRGQGFFPPRDTCFDLRLPNGNIISAKVCQQDGKAIMSNPNKELGHWLLRDVFEIEEGVVITYDMLKIFNVDSVIFTKENDNTYSIDFCELGTYEKFYDVEENEGVE